MSTHPFNPQDYEDQLQQKIAATEQDFAPLGITNTEVFTSPVIHYRMRAEFKMWHDKTGVSYAMFQPGSPKVPYKIESFKAGSVTIARLMPALIAKINSHPNLRHKLFQAEFLTSSLGEGLVTLIYHKPLQDEWKADAQQIAEELGISVIGRSRKQKLVIGNDYVTEEFHVGGESFRYRHMEGSFTQPNAAICEKMLGWAFIHTRNSTGDLLELYCGNGNFTLPLSRNFNCVLATEISKASVNAALANISQNSITNIQIARMSSEELTQALNRERLFKRLADIDLDGYHFSTVFVDPPRAGLDDATIDLLRRFNTIIYISCNPATLKENLIALSPTHKVVSAALFDQFPYTDHRECGVKLVKSS